MAQKQDGIRQSKIKGIYSLIVLFILLLSHSCSGQDYKIIDKEFKLDNYGKIIDYENTKILESTIFRKVFNEKNKYFINIGGTSLGENSSVEYYYSTDKIKTPYDLDFANSNKYLFFTSKDNILRDTLKVNKGYVFSICQLDKENRKKGIAIGKYSINKEEKEEFFEIRRLYSIDNKGKLRKEILNTIIYDCPVPNDYQGKEDLDISYVFGTANGKKYKRYWYEDEMKEIKNQSNENIIDTFSYDFNNDKKTDRVDLISSNSENYFKFYDSNFALVFETKIPNEHVFIEHQKYKNDRRLPISLIEKNQSIIAYISFKSSNSFKVTEICHVINEITPIGYKEKEICKKSDIKMSELTFNKALNIIEE